MQSKRKQLIGDETGYRSADGFTVSREYGKTPNGNPMNGRWVLRTPAGDFVDFHRYRSDLAEHNNLELCPPNPL